MSVWVWLLIVVCGLLVAFFLLRMITVSISNEIPEGHYTPRQKAWMGIHQVEQHYRPQKYCLICRQKYGPLAPLDQAKGIVISGVSGQHR